MRILLATDGSEAARGAGALIAALPTIVVYLALGKFFMRGLLAGSVKG